MKYSQITFLSVLALAEAQQSFEGCDMNAYYSSLGADSSMFDRDGINALVKGRHNVLPFTNQINPGNNDVWAALIDVDAGAEPNSIKLIYEDKEIPAVPFGQRGWIKDHLFPILRGVGITGPDLSDLHGIRASSPLADIVRGIKYYGECGVLVRPETCQSPAEGGAADTCSCNRLFTPPMDVKGDIARALMYMDIRYDGTDANTRDLRLTDCPFQPERDMAYLSQMLTWHAEDPPDEGEILRNDKICQNWQGNRNPFVDFPELATQLWGQPLALPVVGERLIYEECEAIPTLAPTFTPNQCELYSPGDFVVWLMNSEEPSTLAFYSFAEMPEGFELFITDNPWNGEEFIEQEGTLSVSQAGERR
jgi:endonuclease I